MCVRARDAPSSPSARSPAIADCRVATRRSVRRRSCSSGPPARTAAPVFRLLEAAARGRRRRATRRTRACHSPCVCAPDGADEREARGARLAVHGRRLARRGGRRLQRRLAWRPRKTPSPTPPPRGSPRRSGGVDRGAVRRAFHSSAGLPAARRARSASASATRRSRASPWRRRRRADAARRDHRRRRAASASGRRRQACRRRSSAAGLDVADTVRGREVAATPGEAGELPGGVDPPRLEAETRGLTKKNAVSSDRPARAPAHLVRCATSATASWSPLYGAAGSPRRRRRRRARRRVGDGALVERRARALAAAAFKRCGRTTRRAPSPPHDGVAGVQPRARTQLRVELRRCALARLPRARA